MNRRIPGILAAAFAVLCALLPAAAAAAPPAAPGELVVGLGAGAPRATLRAATAAGARVDRAAGRMVIEHAGAADADRLRRLPGVRYVEPNYLYRAAALPNDPLIGEQWQFDRGGALGASQAWDQTTGGDVVVAVVDTGIDLAHPDLADNLWTNPGEVPGNGVDDDRNGFVDDVHGASIVSRGAPPADDEGHGTHVAGIIAARGGNGIGVTGVAWRARLMAVKVLTRDRSGTATDLADGIRYAAANGARVINVSVNGSGRSTALEDAIRFAQSEGALVVASAGNDARDIDVDPSYPAAYPEDNVIAVAATTPNGLLASFSNRGTRSVDVSAPGDEVLSTALGGDYELRSGTSMAAPHVAGALALLAAARPALGAGDLRAALLGGARPTPALLTDVTAGALDLAGALRRVIPPAEWRTAPAPLRVALAAPRVRRGTRTGVVTLRWSTTGDPAGVTRFRILLNGRTAGEVAAAATGAGSMRLRLRLRPGLYRARLVALDATGVARGEASARFRVSAAPALSRAAHARGGRSRASRSRAARRR